jgi:hypothetical protein
MEVARPAQRSLRVMRSRSIRRRRKSIRKIKLNPKKKIKE